MVGAMVSDTMGQHDRVPQRSLGSPRMPSFLADFLYLMGWDARGAQPVTIKVERIYWNFYFKRYKGHWLINLRSWGIGEKM